MSVASSLSRFFSLCASRASSLALIQPTTDNGPPSAAQLWTPEENASVFQLSGALLAERQLGEPLLFDKDDGLAVEFVTSASNLRSANYSIPVQSLFTAKGMAGNIIHAIATTNAIISGCVLGCTPERLLCVPGGCLCVCCGPNIGAGCSRPPLPCALPMGHTLFVSGLIPHHLPAVYPFRPQVHRD